MVTGDMTLSSASTQFVQVPVQAFADGLVYDPSSDMVEMSFVSGGGAPPALSWHTGSWTQNLQGTWLAQVLVGVQNGGVILVPATYTVWVRITDNPEIPVIPAGTLTIT